MAAEAEQLFNLMSSDGETFEVTGAVAMKSLAIKVVFADCTDYTDIPVPNITGRILAMIVEYCKRHVDSDDEKVEIFDAEFVRVDQATLFDLILAANYLNIQSLLDLTCQTVADMIKGKTPEEIRRTFNIKNDLAPEEEEEGYNAWAFE